MPDPSQGQAQAAASAAAAEARRKAQAARGQYAAGVANTSVGHVSGGAQLASGMQGYTKAMGQPMNAMYNGVKAVPKAFGALGASSPFQTAKINPYEPTRNDFNLMGTPGGATIMANTQYGQQVGAQQAGQQGLQQQQAAAGQYAAQGAGIQGAQGQVAAGNMAQGATNAQQFGATAGDFNRQSNNANFRPGTQVGYGESQALGRQQLQDRAAALGLANRQIAYAEQGPGPSAAEAQLQAGADKAMLGNLALARSGRGMGQNAAALRGAVNQNADMQMQTNQAAGQLRAQEASNWRGQQLQAFGQAQQGLQNAGAQSLQARGLAGQEAQFQGSLSDQQKARNDALASQYASLGLNAQQFGAQNQLAYNQLASQNQGMGYQYGLGYNQLGQQATQSGLNYNLGQGQLAQGYGQMGLRSYEDQLNASMAYQQLQSGNQMSAAQFNAGAQNQQNQGLIGAGMGLIGGLLSDEDKKKDILPLDQSALGERDQSNPVQAQAQSIQEDYEKKRQDAMKPPAKKSGGLLGGLLSDEHSKAKIKALENENDALKQAVGGATGTAGSGAAVFAKPLSRRMDGPPKYPAHMSAPAPDWAEIQADRDENVAGPPVLGSQRGYGIEDALRDAAAYGPNGDVPNPNLEKYALDYADVLQRTRDATRPDIYGRIAPPAPPPSKEYKRRQKAGVMEYGPLTPRQDSQLEHEQPPYINPVQPDNKKPGTWWPSGTYYQQYDRGQELTMSDENKKKDKRDISQGLDDIKRKYTAAGLMPSEGRFADVTPDDERKAAQYRTMHPDVGAFQANEHSRDRQMDALGQMEGLSREFGRPSAVDFSKVPAYSYQYKNPSEPGAAPGTQVGPMAQDLHHVPGVVQHTPQGEMVSTPRLTMANTAAISQTQRENDALKKQLDEMKAKYDAALGQRAVYPQVR